MGQKCVVDTGGKVQCVCKKEIDCPVSYSPVCGSDGETYLNNCVLQLTACRKKEGSILTQQSVGECGQC